MKIALLSLKIEATISLTPRFLATLANGANINSANTNEASRFGANGPDFLSGLSMF